MAVTLRYFASPSASVRLEAARAAIARLTPGTEALVIGATRAGADELAYVAAAERSGLFGITRMSAGELATKLALPILAGRGLSPTGGLGAEAIAARATFDAEADGALQYFAPVARLPGFPRALARTLAELRVADVDPSALAGLEPAGSDLAALVTRVANEHARSGTVDRADLLAAATAALEQGGTIVAGRPLVLLDVAIASEAERRFVRAAAAAASDVLATVVSGDRRTLAALGALGFQAAEALPAAAGALARLQQQLFARETVASGEADASVVLFSAPGEGREALEIARRVLDEAAVGVAFDQIAVLLRAPGTYLGLLEHAFERAGIPAWFERGTRRPDPSGRALLALLACADEELSARRFAEYLSLGQVPPADEEPVDGWAAPTDEIVDALVAAPVDPDEPLPEDEAQAAGREHERNGRAAGTLRAPWRWEELLVESAVIGHRDRWERRLRGLREEYRRKLAELRTDEPESPRIPAIRRDIAELDALRGFALPVIHTMADWPKSGWRWGEWLSALGALAPRVLRRPSRVQRVLQEMAPLAGIGPVTLTEVRDVLSPRLLTLTHEPSRRRYGRVFVGTPGAARGRTFHTVFVPGLAERVFPQRLREDALLLDEVRARLGAALPIQHDRGEEERLQLRLAIGAAASRVYLSWPRVELQESRQRVPSFYVLDVARAVEGRIPDYAGLRDRAYRAGGAMLAWPAPDDPERAIDDFEHDLSMLYQLLREPDRGRARGRARYLYELSPHVQRSLTGRWARWQPRWHQADGLIRTTLATAPALARQRLGARPFSLSALQRFADCPYQFHLSAIFRLAPLEAPAPLQRLDPLTRGSLFHEIQATFFRALEQNGLLPLTDRRADAARKMLDWAIAKVSKQAYDDLAPAIDRVWSDELASIARDLRGWFDLVIRDAADWRPERFEFAFGLPGDLDRDPRSVNDPAIVDGRFRIRGSIDLVERRHDGRAFRVTDHKTGRNRTTLATMVDGGRVLQPIVYGLALEALEGVTVEEGRLSYCTAAGGFTEHRIPLNELSRRRAIEVLEVVDRSIEHGTLAARPSDGACARCDFTVVCGAREEDRTQRKPVGLFADLDALRRIP